MRKVQQKNDIRKNVRHYSGIFLSLVLAFLRCQGQRFDFAVQNYNKKMTFPNFGVRKCH